MTCSFPKLSVELLMKSLEVAFPELQISEADIREPTVCI